VIKNNELRIILKIKRLKLIPKLTSSASKSKKKISLNQWDKIELIKKKDNTFNDSTLKFIVQSIGHWEIAEEHCRICWKNLSSEPAIRCPNCVAPFHQQHWEKWIRQKHVCPICRTKIQL